MGRPVMEGPDPGAQDPLDARVADVAAPGYDTRRWPPRTRLALGLSPRAMPGLLPLLLGVALGPHGLGLLSSRVLSSIDPALPVALAALGVLIGLGLNVRASGERRVLAAAGVESGVTMAIVAAGTALFAQDSPVSSTVPWWFLAAALGICAATSSPVVSGRSDSSGSLVSRLGDLSDLVAIVLGGVALALVREGSIAAALALTLQASAVALTIGVAGWLLLGRSRSETEQRVYVVALLLLLGGVAEYLSLSALATGLVAGLFWEAVGGPAREAVRRDALHIQHPVLVLVLIVAGAHVDLPTGWLQLGLAYLLLRTASKLAGGWLARRVAGAGSPHDLGLALLSPGVVGVAFALNAFRVGGPDLSPLLSAVVFGAVGSELVATFVRPREGAE